MFLIYDIIEDGFSELINSIGFATEVRRCYRLYGDMLKYLRTRAQHRIVLRYSTQDLTQGPASP
jgi:hypothetical protein